VAEHNQGALVAAEAAEILARIIRARRRREELLSAELFADPAWDILLLLYLGRLTGLAVPAADVALPPSVPESTRDRWFGKLEEDGWIRRTPDPENAGAVRLELSARGAAAMQSWVNDLAENGPERLEGAPVTSLLERIERARRES